MGVSAVPESDGDFLFGAEQFVNFLRRHMRKYPQQERVATV